MWLSEAVNEKHIQIIPKQTAVVFLYSQTCAQFGACGLFLPFPQFYANRDMLEWRKHSFNYIFWSGCLLVASTNLVWS